MKFHVILAFPHSRIPLTTQPTPSLQHGRDPVRAAPGPGEEPHATLWHFGEEGVPLESPRTARHRPGRGPARRVQRPVGRLAKAGHLHHQEGIDGASWENGQSPARGAILKATKRKILAH